MKLKAIPIYQVRNFEIEVIGIEFMELIVVLIGSKADLENRRQLDPRQIEDYARQHNLLYFECCAVGTRSTSFLLII
jgi:hypothetical protein